MNICSKELKKEVDPERVKARLIHHFSERFEAEITR